MTGRVDLAGRALLPVTLRHPTGSPDLTFDTWIDTGFNGDLVLPGDLITRLGLPIGVSNRAVLADGSEIAIDAYLGQMDWFGTRRSVEVIANDGRFPLLGVGLLVGRVLRIDYAALTLSLD
jgi:clan AA aspartic protease